jgi:hypothetical protein
MPGTNETNNYLMGVFYGADLDNPVGNSNGFIIILFFLRRVIYIKASRASTSTE